MKNAFQHVWFISFLLIVLSCSTSEPEVVKEENDRKPDRNMGGVGLPRGVIKSTDGIIPGYVLFDVTNSVSSYLINRRGEVVHDWNGNFRSLNSYLTDSGTVVRSVIDPDFPFFPTVGGNSGRIQEISWEGDVIWDFEFATEDHLTHHDIALMPNGNVLAIAWETKTEKEALAAGRNQEFTPKAGIWPDMVVEIEPIRPRGGKIVWEWRSWDHMIQDTDPQLPNYGNPSEHPELLDINASAEKPEPIHPDTLALRKRRRKAHRNTTIDNEWSDVHHMNAIDYNEALDQITLSSYQLGEIFIIDHSTTTSEAAGHAGGNFGKGGDFLYRWGNPENYQLGDSTDRKLFHQHDVRWIEEGKPGAGNLTLFNNDIPMGPDSLNYSAVLEIVPEKDAQGNYTVVEGKPFGPEAPLWTYTARDTISFFASFVSGAHRMENGNTFVTCGPAGRTFEVTLEGEIVWEYWVPYRGKITRFDGEPRPGGNMPHQVFRTTFIPDDHPALNSKDLKPIDPQPSVWTSEASK